MPQTADEQTRGLLDMMAANPGPKLYELPIEMAREMLDQVAKSLDIERTEVASVEDVTVTSDGGSFTVRIYSPDKAGTGPLSALVMFHGGGFSMGSIDGHDNIARYICAKSGRKVVSVDYRLAPEHPFPTGLYDCNRAVEWLFENAAGLNVDTDKISLIGDSAGANLCAGVAQISNRNFQSLILLYPCCDLSLESSYASRDLYGGGDHFLSMEDVKWIMANYAPHQDTENNSLLSPLKCDDFSGWPATLVITAGMDLLRDEAKEFSEKLTAAGVDCSYSSYEGTIHGFVSFAGQIDQGKQCLDQICQYLTD